MVKKKVLDYRHNRCKCGNTKLKVSPRCRKCENKRRKKEAEKRKGIKKFGREIKAEHNKRDIQKKKYDKLKAELIKLERKIIPSRYTYRVFLIEGERYIQFGSDLVYPVKMASTILRSSAKMELKDGSEQIGLILQIPNPFPKKKGKKNARRVRTTKTKAVRRRKK
ncbi:MAG: hypothetical protein KAJ49_04585 [Arcobacteraceae bacterium]|nr:hypothetical protein [Arcobacteraceae bacterium]